MVILRTISGKELECDNVVKGSIYNLLNIYTNKIKPIDAYRFFENSKDLETILVIKNPIDISEEPKVDIYNGYIEIYGIEKSVLYSDPNEIVIRLSKAE